MSLYKKIKKKIKGFSNSELKKEVKLQVEKIELIKGKFIIIGFVVIYNSDSEIKDINIFLKSDEKSKVFYTVNLVERHDVNIVYPQSITIGFNAFIEIGNIDKMNLKGSYLYYEINTLKDTYNKKLHSPKKYLKNLCNDMDREVIFQLTNYTEDDIESETEKLKEYYLSNIDLRTNKII